MFVRRKPHPQLTVVLYYRGPFACRHSSKSDVCFVCLAGCRVLQGLLACATDRHTRTGSRSDARVVALACNQSLQLALLTCAVEVTCFCSTGLASFPSIASALGHTSAALQLWEAAHHFLRYLEAETAVPVAESVASYLLFICMKVTEDLAWREGSTMYTAICHGGGGSCKQGDYALLTGFLESVAALSRSRVSATAAGIMLHNKALDKVADFPEDCAWLMSAVLQEHLDLLFNQHLSNIVACCVYGVARAHGVALSFKTVVDIIIATFPHHTAQDFRHAELRSGNGRTQPEYGDTRQLYNQVFLPRMDVLLQQKLPGVQQRGQHVQTLANSSKKQGEPGRLPLRSLSAADMNTRLSRFHRMQA